ncbi:MAG: hypothetical protein ACI4VG_08055 [Lachnospiraceae bacterium]
MNKKLQLYFWLWLGGLMLLCCLYKERADYIDLYLYGFFLSGILFPALKAASVLNQFLFLVWQIFWGTIYCLYLYFQHKDMRMVFIITALMFLLDTITVIHSFKIRNTQNAYKKEDELPTIISNRASVLWSWSIPYSFLLLKNHSLSNLFPIRIFMYACISLFIVSYIRHEAQKSEKRSCLLWQIALSVLLGIYEYTQWPSFIILLIITGLSFFWLFLYKPQNS